VGSKIGGPYLIGRYKAQILRGVIHAGFAQKNQENASVFRILGSVDPLSSIGKLGPSTGGGKEPCCQTAMAAG
jgi:hypothetical protein